MNVKDNVAENWKDFENTLSYYLIATGLNGKMVNPDGTECQTGMTQVAATLCSIMGMDCLKVLYSLPTSQRNKKGYKSSH